MRPRQLLANRLDTEVSAATYRLKTILPKTGHSLIQKNLLSKGVSTHNTVSIRSMWSVLSQTLNLRNPSPDMPDFDREREAYHMRENDEEFIEDFDGIEMKPVQKPDPEPPDLWPLYALIDKRVRTSRGYGKLWQVFSDRIGVVLEDEPDQVTFLEPGEVEPVLKAVA